MRLADRLFAYFIIVRRRNCFVDEQDTLKWSISEIEIRNACEWRPSGYGDRFPPFPLLKNLIFCIKVKSCAIFVHQFNIDTSIRFFSRSFVNFRNKNEDFSIFFKSTRNFFSRCFKIVSFHKKIISYLT